MMRTSKIPPTCGKRDCVYGVAVGNWLVCDYFEAEGHRRPCKADEDCYCYKKLTKKKKGTMYSIKRRNHGR